MLFLACVTYCYCEILHSGQYNMAGSHFSVSKPFSVDDIQEWFTHLKYSAKLSVGWETKGHETTYTMKP